MSRTKERKLTPVPGQRVRLKGRPSAGVLESVNDRAWARVTWDQQGPALCHIAELELETADG